MPVGPNITANEHFAGERLGYSNFVCQVWEPGKPMRWIFMLSRVLEKTTAYAAVCFDFVYQQCLHKPTLHVIQWTDGPKQFKAVQILATSSVQMQKYNLKRMRFEFGCHCHWKGPWDRCIGVFNRIISMAARKNRLSEIAHVKNAFDEYAADYNRRHPNGPHLECYEFMPIGNHPTSFPSMPQRLFLGSIHRSHSSSADWTNERNQSMDEALIGRR